MSIAAADLQAIVLSSVATFSDNRPLMSGLQSKDRRRRRWFGPTPKMPIGKPDQAELLLGREPAFAKSHPSFSATA